MYCCLEGVMFLWVGVDGFGGFIVYVEVGLFVVFEVEGVDVDLVGVGMFVDG